MAATFSAERAISPVDGTVSFVVVDRNYGLHSESSEYLHWLRSADRSRNTERVYAGRLALYLTYCGDHRLDWRAVTHADLGRFLRSLVDEPMNRQMGSQRGSRFRSNKTANAIFVAVCEFLRYAARRGWVAADLVDSLNYPKYVAVNAMWDDRMSGWGRWPSRARALKLREYDAPPECFTDEQVAAVRAALPNLRDQLLVAVLLECGLRIGEALGLRREDMHLLASSAALGCSIRGPHLHVRRRVNSNGALAKSVYPRSIPVTTDLVELYADYQHERHRLVDNDAADFVFINLHKAPVGEPLKYPNAKKMFERLSTSVGFAVRPHMFRHTAATRWLAADTPRDVVQELLGHASPSSMNVYLHPTDLQKRAAVEKVSALGEVTGE